MFFATGDESARESRAVFWARSSRVRQMWFVMAARRSQSAELKGRFFYISINVEWLVTVGWQYVVDDRLVDG